MRVLLLCIIVIALVSPAAVAAQDAPERSDEPRADTTSDDTLAALRATHRLSSPVERGGVELPAAVAVLPGTTINTPTAFGARWGQVYAGASVQERIRYADWTDGVVTMGAGFGDPEKWVGLDVTLNILDTYTELAKDRSVSLKLHRRLPASAAIAVGWENIWHTEGTDGGSSPYAVVSKSARLHDGGPWVPFGVMAASVGVGGDRFQSEGAFLRGDTGAGVFGSLAVRLLRPVHAIANWTGQDLSLGMSITPLPRLPIVITPALMDVTGRAGDGVRFSMSAAIIYDFNAGS
ncbi:hypothetical protein CRI94_03930 [Longibacter salinarum]|uniref:Transporter n=2 Tax=Longibacter salinarum TaxID=1850348 RepID=A0A2A8D0L9_9BACT|nr:hypothetical protein CRI94_03930 [Longibacter salinarum]